MVIVCTQCREVVHTAAGYILQHGVKNHGTYSYCSASGTQYIQNLKIAVGRSCARKTRARFTYTQKNLGE